MSVVTNLPDTPSSCLAQQAAPGPGVRQIGTVREIKANQLVLSTDAGAEILVDLQESTQLLRAEPGQTDLKSAAAMEFRDIQVGDRVLVRGKSSEDGKSLAATVVVAIKKEAIEQKHAREREDWQKRGLSGLVKAVDPAARTITITTSALTGRKPVVVHVPPQTVLRRYAANSVRFDDAKLGKFDDVRAGDQFRGRGQRSEDGSEFTAEEIITGSFRSIAGRISSVDLAAKTLTVADLISKHPVTVWVTADSAMRVLPAQMAETIAMQVRVSAAGGINGGAPQNANVQPPAAGGPPVGAGPPPGGSPGGVQSRGNGEGGRPPGMPGQNHGGAPGGGAQDFQQTISRLPAATLADFPKGQAVMIVATPGKDLGEATAINMVGGVEPLLRATPEGGEMMLSPWSLGGGAQEGSGGGSQ